MGNANYSVRPGTTGAHYEDITQKVNLPVLASLAVYADALLYSEFTPENLSPDPREKMNAD